MLPSLTESLAQELAALRSRERYRQSPAFELPDGAPTRVHAILDGRPVVNFCSNDYLGLAGHPHLLEAARSSAARSGLGASASRLVSGGLGEHRHLEQLLASYLRLPAALLFPTGYQANVGVVTALANGSDLVVSDAANHASIIDGCRLSRAAIRIYPHRDMAAARTALTDRASDYRRRILVSESLFSMDGDTAPLADLADVAQAAGAALVVDEAHALGVAGPSGRGLCAAAGVVPDALVGTLGKAFGSFGGFVAGTPEVRAVLENRARTFIFTTAPPPSMAAAAAAALELAAGPDGDLRRHQLATNISALLSRLAPHLPFSQSASPAPNPRSTQPLQPHPGPRTEATQIVPLVLGDDRRAMAASRALLEHGFFVQAIRPPTVPEGTARLRLTLSAAHSPDEITALVAALEPLLGHP